MIENGSLQLLYNNIPVTLQHAYTLLALATRRPRALLPLPAAAAAAAASSSSALSSRECNGLYSSLNSYIVFASLRSRGFIVMRPNIYPQFKNDNNDKNQPLGDTHSNDDYCHDNANDGNDGKHNSSGRVVAKRKKWQPVISTRAVSSLLTTSLSSRSSNPSNASSEITTTTTTTTTTTAMWNGEKKRRSDCASVMISTAKLPSSILEATINQNISTQESSDAAIATAASVAALGYTNDDWFHDEYESQLYNNGITSSHEHVFRHNALKLGPSTHNTPLHTPLHTPVSSLSLPTIMPTPSIECDMDVFYVWRSLSVSGFKKSRPTAPEFVLVVMSQPSSTTAPSPLSSLSNVGNEVKWSYLRSIFDPLPIQIAVVHQWHVTYFDLTPTHQQHPRQHQHKQNKQHQSNEHYSYGDDIMDMLHDQQNQRLHRYHNELNLAKLVILPPLISSSSAATSSLSSPSLGT
jgi:hypothetical protein